jgi:hypothetical protein
VEDKTTTTAAAETTEVAEATTGVAAATMAVGKATTAVAMVVNEEASVAARATSTPDTSAVVEAEVHLARRTAVRETIVHPADGRSDSRRPIRSAGTVGKWATGGVSARCEPLTCRGTLNLRRMGPALAAAMRHRQPPQPDHRQGRQPECRRETRRGSRGRGSAARGGSIPYARQDPRRCRIEAPRGQSKPAPDKMMTHMADEVVWSRGKVAVRPAKREEATEWGSPLARTK